jgi:hypothetical protein
MAQRNIPCCALIDAAAIKHITGIDNGLAQIIFIAHETLLSLVNLLGHRASSGNDGHSKQFQK